MLLVVTRFEVIETERNMEYDQISSAGPDVEFTGDCRHINEVDQVRRKQEVSETIPLQRSGILLDGVERHPGYSLFVLFLALLTPNTTFTITINFH
jgi:hypothetical protein